jgi:hypothetical protein
MYDPDTVAVHGIYGEGPAPCALMAALFIYVDAESLIIPTFAAGLLILNR